MARITVEDCLEKVENRFHLVRVASKRARQLMNGKEPTLEWDNDKATVLALREIAAGNITEEMLNEKPVVNENEDGIFDQSEIDAEIGALLNTDESEAKDKSEAKDEPEAKKELETMLGDPTENSDDITENEENSIENQKESENTESI